MSHIVTISDRNQYVSLFLIPPGITANFVNKNTEQEARIEEISGVAALFNQKFFNDLKTELGIELENIVYYKDDTHYFVMTAKKTCLLEKKVLRQVRGTSNLGV